MTDEEIAVQAAINEFNNQIAVDAALANFTPDTSQITTNNTPAAQVLYDDSGVMWVQHEDGTMETYNDFVSNMEQMEMNDPDVLMASNNPNAAPEESALAQDIIDNFYNDTRAETEEKIAELEEMGYDTTELRAQVQQMRDDLASDQANYMTDAQFDQLLDDMNAENPFLNPDNVGPITNQDYLDNVNDVAADVIDDVDVQPGYPDDNDLADGVPPEPGQTNDTWCNRALERMLTALGNVILSDNPHTGIPDIDYTTANQMAENISNAAANPNSSVSYVTAAEAQDAANDGQAVVAAWSNPGGHGHVALVVPDAEDYDPTLGPHISQAGTTNYSPSDNKYVRDTFPSAWGNEEVEFYILGN